MGYKTSILAWGGCNIWYVEFIIVTETASVVLCYVVYLTACWSAQHLSPRQISLQGQ